LPSIPFEPSPWRSTGNKWRHFLADFRRTIERRGDGDLDAKLIGPVRLYPCRCIPPPAYAGCGLHRDAEGGLCTRLRRVIREIGRKDQRAQRSSLSSVGKLIALGCDAPESSESDTATSRQAREISGSEADSGEYLARRKSDDHPSDFKILRWRLNSHPQKTRESDRD
jgi:hypothetical protein